jgi:hypothetical protein
VDGGNREARMPDLWNSGAVVLFVLFAICCMGCVVTGESVRDRVKRHHPTVWRKMGFRTQDGFWTKPEDEKRVTSAQSDLSWLARSGGLRKLDDPELNLLVRRQARFIKAAAVIAVLGIVFLLLRP